MGDALHRSPEVDWEAVKRLFAEAHVQPYHLRESCLRTGFAVPFGILVAGITIPGAFMRLIPKWLVVLGMAIAICGELSWLSLMVPAALPLVPLARFPGVAWVIATGLSIPTSIERSSSTDESRARK